MTSSKRSSYSRFSSSRITWSAGNRRTCASGRPYSTRRWRAARTSSFVLGSRVQPGPQALGQLVGKLSLEELVHEQDEPLEPFRAHRGAVIQVAEHPLNHPDPVTLRASIHGYQWVGQVRQRPVKVGTAGLLQHLLQGADGRARGRKAHEVAHKGRVLAQVACQGEDGLGGPQRVVETARGDLGAHAHLECLGQGSELLHVGDHHVDPLGLQSEQDLPVGIVEPGRPVGLSERESSVIQQLAGRQFLERHDQQLLATFNSLLVEEELVLFRETLQVILDGVSGIHLLELRQEQVAEGRFGGGRRLYGQPDQGFRVRSRLVGPAGKNDESQRGAAQNRSEHGTPPVRVKEHGLKSRTQFKSDAGSGPTARKGGS